MALGKSLTTWSYKMWTVIMSHSWVIGMAMIMNMKINC